MKKIESIANWQTIKNLLDSGLSTAETAARIGVSAKGLRVMLLRDHAEEWREIRRGRRRRSHAAAEKRRAHRAEARRILALMDVAPEVWQTLSDRHRQWVTDYVEWNRRGRPDGGYGTV